MVRLLPLVAAELEDDQLIATATLENYTSKHIGEQALYAKPIRHLGLGSRMVNELVLSADRKKLHWLKVEVVTNHRRLIKALHRKRFEMSAALKDFFRSKDGIMQKRWQIWKYIFDVNWR